ncbi:MAG: substrate-binding domain-containing protein, partial [Eubacteriales bacterium]|nr:substrate-binding domain-containing protein [Eubacteriales bacterium]
MNKYKNRRPKVGIIVGNYHTDHPIHLVHTVWKLLQEKGVDAQFYLGTESSSFLGKSRIQENLFDYQYASLYGYSHFDDLDVLIVSSGTLFIYRQEISLEEFLATLPKIPVVLLEADLPVEDGCYIITDNCDSIHELVEHLITVHGAKKIGFITGTVGNRDSDYRLQAFLDVMESHGLPVPESCIQHGDYSEHVYTEVARLLDDNPGLDAIVCANDEMAMCAYAVCQSRGLVVGKGILITGFDNIRLAEYMNPPLTTCCQDYETISRHAVDRVMDILEGRPVSSEVVSSPVLYRDSCGCSHPHSNDEATRTREREDLIQRIWEKHDEQMQPWIGALLYREMLTDTIDLRTFFDHLGKSLADLGTEESYITLLPETLRLPLQNVMPPIPEELRLEMVQNQESWTDYDLEKA